jgi:hypothetical protein
LEILVNPTTETKANREGVAYVTARMDWYCEFSILLLKENIVDGGSSAGLRSKLEDYVVDLYKALLLYLMKSVCSYNRDWILSLFRDTIKRDGWDCNLMAIRKAEKTVQQYSADYNTQQIRSHLKQLVEVAKKQETKLLQDIVNAVQNQILMQSDEILKQRLKDLPCAEEAAFDSARLEHEPLCQPGTRAKFLSLTRDWSINPHKGPIFWLSGLAGTGKSTIARTVSHEFSRKGYLGSSFFFSRVRGVTSASKFVTTLAVLLADRLPSVAGHISKAISDHAGIAEKNKRDQWKHLIVEPLLHVTHGRQAPMTLIFVVDALDECESVDDVRVILQLFATSKKFDTFQLRLFVTSGPELPINTQFKLMDGSIHQDVVLHEMFEADTTEDISAFLERELMDIGKRHNLPPNWIDNNDFERLVEKAGGLFIYATTACRFIGDDNWSPREQLSILLTGDGVDPNSQTDQLDKIYIHILHKSITGKSNFCDKSRLLKRFQHVVGCIVVLFQPLAAKSLAKMLQIRPEDVKATVQPLGSILNVSQIEEGPLRTLHPSFGDFLLNERRCNDRQLWVDGKEAHTNLARRCLELLSSHLKKDICSLSLPGILIGEVKLEEVKQSIPTEVQYACLYWVHHLQWSCLDHSLLEAIYTFLTQHLLYWLEALSLMRSMSSGVAMIGKLEVLLAVSIRSLTSKVLL